MNSKWHSVFISLLLLVAVNANATKINSSTGQHSVGIGFGQILLMGDFASRHSNDLGLNFIYGYKASDEFELMVDYGYSKHTSDDKLNGLKVKSLIPSLRINLSEYDQFMVFIFGGFGIYEVSESIGPRTGSVLTFGFSAGPGFDLKLNDQLKFGSFVSLHNIFSKNDPDAKNPAGQGMTIGGAYTRLFLTLRYTFN